MCGSTRVPHEMLKVIINFYNHVEAQRSHRNLKSKMGAQESRGKVKGHYGGGNSTHLL